MKNYNQILFVVYMALIVIMSLAAFIAYNVDKKKAIKGQMRIKEKTLLGLAVLNGAIGAYVGRKVAHHKTDKKYFSVTIYFALICQIVIGVFLGYLAYIA